MLPKEEVLVAKAAGVSIEDTKSQITDFMQKNCDVYPVEEFGTF